MLITRVGVLAGIVAGAVALTACGSDSNVSSSPATTAAAGGTSSSATSSTTTAACASGTLKSEGSTAQKNAMDQWVKDYQTQCSGATVTYNGTGSGAGVSNFIAKQDDFAGSDSALDASKGEVADAAKACGSPAIDIPMVTGPIAIAYNLQRASRRSTLTPERASPMIMLGKITKWNDSAIAKRSTSRRLAALARRSPCSTARDILGHHAELREATWPPSAPSVWKAVPRQGLVQGRRSQARARRATQARAVRPSSSTEGTRLPTSSGPTRSSEQPEPEAQIDNGAGAVSLTSDSAVAKTVSRPRRSPRSGTANDLTLKLDYATKTAGAYPIVLVTYEVVCTKYKDANIGQGIPREVVPDVSRPSTAEPERRCNSLGYARPAHGQHSGQGARPQIAKPSARRSYALPARFTDPLEPAHPAGRVRAPFTRTSSTPVIMSATTVLHRMPRTSEEQFMTERNTQHSRRGILAARSAAIISSEHDSLEPRCESSDARSEEPSSMSFEKIVQDPGMSGPAPEDPALEPLPTSQPLAGAHRRRRQPGARPLGRAERRVGPGPASATGSSAVSDRRRSGGLVVLLIAPGRSVFSSSRPCDPGDLAKDQLRTSCSRAASRSDSEQADASACRRSALGHGGHHVGHRDGARGAGRDRHRAVHHAVRTQAAGQARSPT